MTFQRAVRQWRRLKHQTMKSLFFAWVWLATVGHAAALTNKVLIIGIDGTMPSALAVASTPNLNALKSNGCFSVRVVSHPVTHSAVAWSSMFTGVWGDKHGVNDPGNSSPEISLRAIQASSNAWKLRTAISTRWPSRAGPGRHLFPHVLPESVGWVGNVIFMAVCESALEAFATNLELKLIHLADFPSRFFGEQLRGHAFELREH
jgi:hypothetical protein